MLYQLQDPGNAGMIIRTADALGLDGVIFTESCDIYNPKVVRSTMGSIFRIPVYRDIPADDVFFPLWTVLKLIHMPLLWTEMPLTLKQLTSETEEVLSLVMRGTDCLKK